jgi:hypothetical protein
MSWCHHQKRPVELATEADERVEDSRLLVMIGDATCDDARPSAITYATQELTAA